VLEDRWQSEDEAMRNAADDTEGLADRREGSTRSAKGARAGSAGHVPQVDHVENPVDGSAT
jgi:hypothetical protein